jgi:hypothetical protein
MLELHLRTFWASVAHVFEHVLAVVFGLALVILGLAMTFSIVFVIPGIVVLAVGVSIVAAGVFAHALTTRPPRHA